MAGELPVGIGTYGKEDVPHWPKNNIRTTPAGRWLWVAADLYEEDDAQ